jgi:DnaJ-class molecular chaperone
MKDPYKILEVEKSAGDDEIRKKYRELAKKYHPDLNPNMKDAEQKFKEISVAYKLIENKEAREKFEKGEFDEQFRKQSERSGPFYHEFQGDGGRYNYYYEGDIGDIFQSLFGDKGKGRAFDLAGQDILYQMEIDLRDAIGGAEKEITLSGNKRLKVKIPPGVRSGTKLKFKGQGGPGIGKGSPGDAYVILSIKLSPIFKINGNNIEMTVPISLDEAINGTKINIHTVTDTVLLHIPQGVNTGTKLRIKGKGFPSGNGDIAGDQIVKIKVVLPEKNDDELRSFIKKWSEKNPYNPREYSNYKDVKE